MTVSLQGPFFPQQAEKKGVSPGVYGFVFGVFQLVNFVVAPIYGKTIQKIGPRFLLITGNYVTSCSCILFGFLDLSPAGAPFVALAFTIRIVEALGQSAFVTAAYAIVAKEYPDRIASVFSTLETVFGLGLLIGPSAGGLLYEVGGYPAPFLTVGSLLLATTTGSVFLLPSIEDSTAPPAAFLQLLRLPSFWICYYSYFAAAYGIGFLEALLEPHVRQFGLSVPLTGMLFVLNGGIYTLTAYVWGFLADGRVHPKLLCAVGGLLIAVAFLLFGPAPFLPLQPSLWLVILALILHGLGGGGEIVAAFVDSNQVALKNGFPDSIETYGLLASMWASGFALGNFVGPSLSGILTDGIGIRSSSQVVVVLHLLVALLNFGYFCLEKRKENLKEKAVYEELE